MTIVSNNGFSKYPGKATPYFTEGRGGVAGEVAVLRADVAGYLGVSVVPVADEWTDPPAATANGLKTAIATVAAPVTYSGADFNGALAAAPLNPPRPITITTAGATPADAPATAVITGTDVDGNVQSETVTVPQTATLVTTVKAYRTVTSIALPAADGVAATLAVGIAAPLGFSKKIKLRAGAAMLLAVTEAGTRINPGSFGTVTVPASMGPNGAFTPTSAADGTRDYVVVFEPDNA